MIWKKPLELNALSFEHSFSGMSGQFAEPEPEFESSRQHQPSAKDDAVHKANTRRVPPQTLAQLEAQAEVAPDMVQTALEQADGTDVETRNEKRLAKRKASVIAHGEHAVALYGQAQAAQANGELEVYRELLDEALDEIQDCTRQIERALNLIHVPAEREGYFSEVRKYYPVKIQILMALHNEDGSAGYDVQAFEVSEGSRARLHNEQLVRSGMGSREGVNPALLFEERALLRIEARTPEEELRLQELQEQIKNRPYQNVEYRDPLKLAEIQNEVLDEDTALIYYSVQSETKLFVWIVTRESFFTHEIDLNKVDLSNITPTQANPTQQSINLAAQQRSNYRALQIPSSFNRYEPSSLRLGAALIQPLLEHLQSQNCSRIAVATEGVLDLLPFASLIVHDESGKNSFLVEDYEIVYLTSATSIAISREQAQDQIAELDLDSVGVFLMGKFPSDSDLSAAGPEGIAIQNANTSQTDFYTGAEFNTFKFAGDHDFNPVGEPTQENFLNATEAYTILHVVTHGTCTPGQLEDCGLLLRNDFGEEDKLTIPEIPSTEISMSTQLLVLSACETAIGSASGDYISIAHTFAQNGIPRVVGTLWRIGDAGTMRFMEYFYKALLEDNMSPPTALQEAQKKMINLVSEDATVEIPNPEKPAPTIKSYPYYWAAFKLVGDWQWPPRPQNASEND